MVDSMTIKKIMGQISAFVLLKFLMAQNAMAQIGFEAPPDTDMSKQFIAHIFGGLLTGTPGAADAFGGAVAAFNGAILIIGGLLVAYTILAGTLGTAHDGEMLGKQFSSIWLPIRTAFGTAMVLPILPGGYCLMQGLVMWLVMQGVSLGNMIWNAYTAPTQGAQVALSLATQANIRNFVFDVYMAQVCVAASQKAWEQMPEVFRVGGTTSFGQSTINPLGGVEERIRFGNTGFLRDKDFCGYVNIPNLEDVAAQRDFAAVPSATSISGAAPMFRTPSLTPIMQAHINSVRMVIAQTGPIAISAIAVANPTEADQAALVTRLDALANTYKENIRAAITAVLASTEQQASNEARRAHGWFLAGTWMTQIIQAQNRILSAANTEVSRSVSINTIKDESRDSAWEFAQRGYAQIAGVRPEVNAFLNPAEAAGGEAANEGVQQPSVSWDGRIAAFVSGFVMGIDFQDLKSDQRHPLIIMNDMGNRILTGVTAGLVAAIAAAGVGVIAAAVGVNIMPLVTVVFSVIGPLVTVLVGVGGLLAYILPNLPMLLWFGIIIGWTILVVEAIIAAPLWAVMHLHPSGNDIAGKGSAGYSLVLGLILRPALIIFGLIAAIILSGLFGQLLNRVFFSVFSGNSSDASLGFFAIIFGTALYATFMYHIIMTTFSLMHKIPDQLLRWIGGQNETLGQYASSTSTGTMTGSATVSGMAMTHALTGPMNSLGGAFGKNGKLHQWADKNEKERKANNVANIGSKEAELRAASSEKTFSDFAQPSAGGDSGKSPGGEDGSSTGFGGGESNLLKNFYDEQNGFNDSNEDTTPPAQFKRSD